METLLEVRGLSVGFDVDGGFLRAVDGVSFSLGRGGTLGLVGESGCGKSVTALSLLRLIPRPPGRIESGQALLAGRDLLAMPIGDLRKVRGGEVGVVFQEPMSALSPLRTIGSQLAEAYALHRPGATRAEAWQVAEEWLAKVGIPDPAERLRAHPYQFSGGMRQRAMIAGALMLGPSLLIADEPTTALDVTVQAQVFELLRSLRPAGMAMLLITHDLGVVWETCDRVVVMYASQVVEEAPVRVLFADPLHPYTRGLIAAVPPLAGGLARLATIEGQVPPPGAYPPGCHFAERCPLADGRCRAEQPALLSRPDGRRVRCFRAEEAS